MASSGSVDSGGYQGRVIRFSWSLSSDKKTVSYSFTAVGGTDEYYYHHGDTFRVNGITVYSGSSSHKVWRNTVLKSGSINREGTNKLEVEMTR